MKLRTVVGSVIGTAGTTALANRVLRSRATAVEPFLAGEQATYRWRGFDIAYTEAGDPEDEDLLLFHGIHVAASNHEFWRVFEDLAADYHVIAPDLPGLGQSDRPALLYSASLYTTFVRDAVTDLCEDPPIVVGSSLSGSYAAAAAQEADVESLILIGPTTDTMGNRNVWLRTLLRSPLLGEALFNLLASRYSIRHFHGDHGYADPANLPDAVVDYEWTTAHQEGARFAPASFISGFLDPDIDLAAILLSLEVPVTLVWGRDADSSPLSAGRELAEAADARLVVFEDAKLLPHAEHPDRFVDVVRGEPVAET